MYYLYSLIILFCFHLPSFATMSCVTCVFEQWRNDPASQEEEEEQGRFLGEWTLISTPCLGWLQKHQTWGNLLCSRDASCGFRLWPQFLGRKKVQRAEDEKKDQESGVISSSNNVDFFFQWKLNLTRNACWTQMWGKYRRFELTLKGFTGVVSL